MLKKVWSYISENGQSNEYDPDTRSCITITNNIAFYYLLLLLAFFFVVEKNAYSIYTLVTPFFASIIAFFLIRKGILFLPRLIIALIPWATVFNGILFTNVPIASRLIGFQFILLSSILVPLLVFRMQEKYMWLVCISFNMGTMVFLPEIYHLCEPKKFDLLCSVETAENMCMAESVFFIAVFFYYYRRQNITSSADLLASGEKMRRLLERSEEYRKIFDMSFDLICVLKMGGGFIHFNPSWSKLLGYSEEEIYQALPIDFVHHEDREMTIQESHKAFERGDTAYTLTNRYICKDGSIRWLAWNVFFDLPGQRVYSAARDISELKVAYQEVMRNESLFQTAFDQSPDAVLLINAHDNTISDCNRQAIELFEYGSKKEIIGHTMENLAHINLSKLLLSRITQMVRLHGTWYGEIPYLLKSRQEKWCNLSVAYLNNPEINLFMVRVTDITQRKQNETELRNINALLRGVIESTSDGIFAINADWKYLIFNSSHSKYTWSLTGKELNHSEKITAASIPYIGKTQKDDFSLLIDGAMGGKDGSIESEPIPKLYFQTFLNPIKDEKGTTTGVAVFSENITERKLSENKIRNSESRYKAIMDQTLIGILLIDTEDHHIVECNDAFQNILGYTREKLNTMKMAQLLNIPEELFRAQMSILLKKRTPVNYESKFMKKDGILIDVEIFTNIIETATERLICMAMKDITQKKKDELKIRESLTEKEILIAEIHHRVKNNLAVVSGLLQLQASKTDNEEMKDALRESQSRINSIALIHEKLYQNESLARISFDKYIEGLIGQIHTTYDAQNTDINILHFLEPLDLDVTKAIPCGILLNEVLANIYKHAFTGYEKGTITIRLSRNETGMLVLEVQDDGKGFDYKNLPGKSTTLGLSLIQALSKQMGATYSYLRQNGTLFRLESTL